MIEIWHAICDSFKVKEKRIFLLNFISDTLNMWLTRFIKYVRFKYLFLQTTYWTTHHLNDGRIYVFSTIKSVILKFACKDVVNFTPQNDVGFMVVPNIGLHISSPYSS